MSKWKAKIIEGSKGYYLIEKDIFIGNKLLTIQDVHPGHGEDEVWPMMYKKPDADKLVRFLNHYYKGSCTKFHWQVFDRFKSSLKLGDGFYYKG